MELNLRFFLLISLLSQSLLFLGQAISCEAGYYAENNLTCASCGGGKSSPKGALSIDECQPCADYGCETCFGITTNSCVVCRLDYSLQNGQCISSSGGSSGTPYTCADKGCIECFGNNPGQCSNCDVGYYLDNNQCISCGQGKSSLINSKSVNACSPCDDYPNCQECVGLGQGQCISCQSGFTLKNGSCESSEIKCKDSNCLECSGPGTEECILCKGTFHLINGECLNCDASDPNCSTCDDKNCELCDGRGIGQCFSCEPNYYLVNKQCVSCSNGKYSLSGSLNSTDCSDCEDENCLTCDGPNIGRCTSCLPGFNLISGTCKLPGESIKTNNKVSASIRYDMTMTQFNEQGGKNYFIAKLSRVLSVDIEQITVKNVRKGSVIVDYEVATSGDETVVESMKKAMDEAVPAGQMDFYSGSKVLNYNSQVGSGDDGSDGKKGSSVGIIVGVVVGAVCIVAAVLIWKKIAMVKAKKASYAETNQRRIAPHEDSVEKTFKTDI